MKRLPTFKKLEKYKVILVLISLSCLVNSRCGSKTDSLKSIYKYLKPNYDLVELSNTSDTISFALNDETYNDIKSFNIFLSDGTEYFSFYDERSESINIYNFKTHVFVKKIKINNWFLNKTLYKTTVYTKNFDSIYINNKSTLYLFNSKGTILKSIGFLKEPPFAWAVFNNNNPPIFKDNKLYVGIRPYVKETSLKAIKKWRLLYGFDMLNSSALQYYHFPELYQNDFYGFHFFDYSYCYNDRGNFVFSFPADTSIYETNLQDYNINYFAKSKLQTESINPLRKEDLVNDKGYMEYLARDSYGAIFFDYYAKRYIRVAKSKISKMDFEAKRWKKKQRVIIFNKNFKIIGESEIDGGVSLSSIFFTKDGEIYARVRTSDEYAIHFIRLAYNDNLFIQQNQVTKK